MTLRIVVHVGFVDGGAPVVMPYIGALGQYDNEPYAMYIHGTSLSLAKLILRIHFEQDNETYEKQELR